MRFAATIALARAALVVTGVLAAVAAAAPGADPGVGETTILLGATASLADSESAAIARGASAYFRYVNARGGVNGRTITYKVVDDGGDPAQAVQATLRLVDGDGAFAIVGAAGREQNLATRPYLNAAKVPQLFVDSRATTFGADYRRYPWTVGFRPSARAEGAVYGRYISRTRAGARIAVLHEDGADGLELLAGLKQGLAGSKARVAVVEPVGEGDLDTQIADLKASGATVLALFAAPATSTEAYAAASRLGWHPLVVASPPAKVEGAVSIAFLKDPADPALDDDPAIRLYRTIMSRYAKGANAKDVDHLHGMAMAYETVKVLRATGETPTRAAILVRMRQLRDASNPFLLPGIVVRTSATDRFPIEQAVLQRWSKGSWRSFGGLWG